MAMIDTTGEISVLIINMSTWTGSIFLSLLLIVIILIALALAMRLPIELTAAAIFPFLIASAILTSAFMPVIGVAIIYVAILITKNFFLNG